MKKMLSLMPLAAALALAGCVNLAPDYERPEAPVAQAWPEGESYANSELKREELPKWQNFIQDDRLKKVIELALSNNRDLRIAALNVENARALYGVQRADLFPTVAAAASNATTHRESTDSTTHAYSADLAMASYEIDFFGRVRNLTEQALQTYLQSEDAQRTTQGTLVSEVTLAWLTLGANREQLALQKETLASQEESFRLVGESYKYGAASRLDYEQARTTVASARAAITTYVRAVAQSKNALELLVGSKVPDELQPSGVELAATLPATMPAGLPSEVLLNRPDIISAERGMISANANIGAARAAFFPSISLTANAGSASAHLSDLFGANTGLWSFTPSISIPIFTGGRNLANLRSAEVQEKIAVATYEKSIQTAFQEVADALATEGTVERELKERREFADAASQAFELSSARYKHGAAAYTEVLDAQRTKVSAQQAVITAELSRASSLVTLYKVLGGGTELPEPAKTTEGAEKGKGLHQLKLRDIAKESGKSLGNLYNYFQNKEAIIEALVEREKSRFLMVASQKIEPLPGEDYKSMLRRHLELMADAYLDPDSLLLAISVAGEALVNPGVHKIIVAANRRIVEHVVALIHHDPSCSMDNVPRELLEARVICIRTFFESLRGAVAFYPDVNREMLKQVTIERLLLIWMWERSKALGMSLEAFEKSMAIK